MKDEQPIAVTVAPPAYEMVATEEATPGSGPNPLLVAHSVLRGRYLWAIGLGLVLATVGAYFGYRLPPLKYRSTGIVQIKPYRPRIVYPSEQNSMMPMFDSFMETQTNLILSNDLLSGAMQNAGWKQLKRELNSTTAAEFHDSVEVEHPRSSELLVISFTDHDPDAAQAGAQAVIDKYYERFWGAHGTDDPANSLNILESLRADKQIALSDLLKKIKSIAEIYSTDSLQPLYDFQLQQSNSIRSQLDQVRLVLASVKGSASDSSSATRPAKPAAVTAESLAPFDPELQRMLEQKRGQQLELKRLENRYGAQWPDVVDARDRLAQLENDIETRLEALRRSRDAADVTPADPNGRSVPVTIAALESREKNLVALLGEAEAKVTTIGTRNLEIKRLQEDALSAKNDLDAVKKRIEQIDVESRSQPRFNFISAPDRPVLPYNDRRAAICAASAGGGAFLGFGIVALIGLVNRRFRTLADARQMLESSIRVLGVLPDLQSQDPEEVATAAHCLHHIRTSLQIHPDCPGRRVFAITSPSAGAGKTSLTLALGLSFSAARSKTLLIDCDLLGGGLTAKIKRGRQRLLGQILVRARQLTQPQLDEALEASAAQKLRLGETLVNLGWARRENIDEALELQNRSRAGLLDVLSGEPLAGCVTDVGVPGLDVLPLGDASAAHVGQLSPLVMRRIIKAAYEEYDTVLIDTGPLSGSLEAAIVCSEADLVVMVLPRGESHSIARETLLQVRNSRFPLAGVVFNRATVSDLETSGFSSSHASSSRWRPPVRTIPFDDELQEDAIASAVATTTASREKP